MANPLRRARAQKAPGTRGSASLNAGYEASLHAESRLRVRKTAHIMPRLFKAVE
jgi:hypothetical protein